jgi:hypothetical protein
MNTWYCVPRMLKILLVSTRVEMYTRVFARTVTSYKSTAEQNHHSHVMWLCLHSRTEAFLSFLSPYHHHQSLFCRWVHPWWFCCWWWWGSPVFMDVCHGGQRVLVFSFGAVHQVRHLRVVLVSRLHQYGTELVPLSTAPVQYYYHSV